MAFATDVTTPPELLSENLTVAVAPEVPASSPLAPLATDASAPEVPASSPLAPLATDASALDIGSEELPPITSASALQSSFVDTADLEQTDQGLDDSILPLTGIRKTYDDIPANLDGQCKGLMTDLGIAPDNVQKLCDEGFYGPIRELKDAFSSALDWYKTRLAELDADESELNALVVNAGTQASVRSTAQQALDILKEQREKVSAAYQGLLGMNELVSRGVDAFDEIRKQLLAAIYVLKQRLQQGGLNPQDMDQSQREIMTQTALDQQLQSQLGSEPGARLEDVITNSVDEVLATESASKKPAEENAQQLRSIMNEQEEEAEDAETSNDESDVEDEEVLL
jgi:hypothetical protein